MFLRLDSRAVLIVALLLLSAFGFGTSFVEVHAAAATLFHDGFENCPVGATTAGCGPWVHGDDNHNAGCPGGISCHNGADIDQPNSDPFPNMLPPKGFHRVYDSGMIPVHSGSKALEILSDNKVGCKVATVTKNIAPVPGGGDIKIIDTWFYVPNNWLIGTPVPNASTRYPLYTLTISNPIGMGGYMRLSRFDISTNYQWAVFAGPSKTVLGSYPVSQDVWHHIQVAYDVSTGMLIDVVFDGVEPFGPLSVPVGSMNWDALLILENTRNVTAGELECVQDSGFQARTYFDDFSIIQTQSNAASQITVTSDQSGAGFVNVDGAAITTPQIFNWVVGSTHTVAANPSVPCGSGCQYAWSSWSDGGTQSHQIKVPSTSSVYAAIFQQQYYLAVDSAHGSSVPGSGWFNVGATVVPSVSSPVGGGAGTQYVCTGWGGSGSVPPSGSSCFVSFSIDAPSSISWNWKTQYYLTMQVSPPGGGSVTPSSGWEDSGANVMVQANTYSVFSSWSGSGVGSYSGVDNPVNISANGPITETANFIAVTQTLTTNVASGSGSVSPNCAEGCQEQVGSSVTLTAAPSSGWVFSSWAVTGASCTANSSSNPCIFAMPNNAVTASAIFSSAPALTVFGPMSPPSPPNGGKTTSTPVSLKVQVQSNGAPVPSASVAVFVDGVKKCSGASSSVGYFVCSYTATKATHSWYATASKTGFALGTSPTWTFTYNPSATTYAINAKIYFSNSANCRTVTVTVTLKDSKGNPIGYNYLQLSCTVLSNSEKLSMLNPGTYTVTITASGITPQSKISTITTSNTSASFSI